MEDTRSTSNGVVANIKPTRLPDAYRESEDNGFELIGYRPPKDELLPAEAKADDLHKRNLLAIYGTFKTRLDTAREQLDAETERWEQIQSEEERLPRYSSQWFYWPFMLVLTLGEIPLNKLSFELFFQESPLMSLVVAGLGGLLLIAMAHRIGMMLRHFRYNGRRGGFVVQSLQVAILTLLAGALVYGVSVLRQGYLTFVSQPELGFAELLQNNQIGEAAQMALSVGLGTEGWIFLLINAAILILGISAAFFCHDPHPDFEKVDRAKRGHEKELMKIRHALADKQSAELRRYASVRHRLKQG